MSAFVVGKTHIDVLVALALDGPSGRAINPGNAWHAFAWYAGEPETIEEARELRRVIEHPALVAAGRSDRVSADDVGQMLTDECVRSVMDLYPDTRDGAALPGPAEPHWQRVYRYERPAYRLTAVEGLSAIDCYEYQSCEHPGWKQSEPRRFCEALRRALIGHLPGYAEAGWEWTPVRITQARARQAGLTARRPRPTR